MALTLLSATAMADLYSVTVNPTLNDLDIKIEPLPNDGVLAVKLTNNTDQKVRCNLEYLADPQLPTRTSIFVKPHKDATSMLRATRQWQAVTVNVECQPAKK
jgi:hypothetical protein